MDDYGKMKEIVKDVLLELEAEKGKGYESDECGDDPRLNIDYNTEDAFELVEFEPGYGDFTIKELFNNNFFTGSYIAGNISWLGPIPECDINDLKAELQAYTQMEQGDSTFDPLDAIEDELMDEYSDEDEFDLDVEDDYEDDELDDVIF